MRRLLQLGRLIAGPLCGSQVTFIYPPALAPRGSPPQIQVWPRRHTTQPVESSLRSEMQRKFLLQPPLSLLQSRTGPKESKRTSRLSKEDEVISSSLWGEQGKVGGVKVTLGGHSCLASHITSHSLVQKSKINHTRSLELTNCRHSPYLGIEPRL